MVMKNIIRNKKNLRARGFSLVETLAGTVILFVLLYGANRSIALSMNNSSQAGTKAYLEADVVNDIERIKVIDDELNRPSNIKTSCNTGGSNGSGYLKQEIEKRYSNPNKPNWKRTLDTSNPRMLVARYEYTTPDKTSQGAKNIRILELHPSFLAQCS